VYSFRSSLMRDVIYTSMTFENRKALHTAAADLLLQASTDTLTLTPALALALALTLALTDLLLQGDGRAAHTKYLAAYYHLRQAENEPRVLGLTTDAAQQARLKRS